MNYLIFTFIIVLFYLLLVGFITVLERKIIGLVQLRLSVFRFLFLGIYQFYLDFFKLLAKGVLDRCFYKIFHYNLVVFIFFFNNVLIFLLILFLSCLNCFLLFDVFLFLLLEGNVLIFKIYIFYCMPNKFVSYNENRFKRVILFLEIIYVYLVIIVVFFSSVSVGFNFFIIFVFLLFLVSMVKMFRTPFDYLESESELVNGISLEFYGYSFLLWSLVEYSSIFNNIFFVSFVLVSLVFGKSLFFIVFFNTIFLCIVLFVRSVFVRVKIESCIFFIIYVYCFINFLLFIFLIL